MTYDIDVNFAHYKGEEWTLYSFPTLLLYEKKNLTINKHSRRPTRGSKGTKKKEQEIKSKGQRK